jgi:hypothetical protein
MKGLNNHLLLPIFKTVHGIIVMLHKITCTPRYYQDKILPYF